MHEGTDLHRVLGALHQARAALDLDTAHLCYLIALRVRAERGNLASLTEDDLVDLYLQVCELIDPDAVHPRVCGERPTADFSYAFGEPRRDFPGRTAHLPYQR